MRRTVDVAGFGLTLWANFAAAQPQPEAPAAVPAVASQPAAASWLKKPSLDNLLSVYPRSALRRRLEGHAVIHCSVTASGTLADCHVVDDSPSGEGFGTAALKLARFFRNSAGGGSDTVPIVFRPLSTPP